MQTYILKFNFLYYFNIFWHNLTWIMRWICALGLCINILRLYVISMISWINLIISFLTLFSIMIIVINLKITCDFFGISSSPIQISIINLFHPRWLSLQSIILVICLFIEHRFYYWNCIKFIYYFFFRFYNYFITIFIYKLLLYRCYWIIIFIIDCLKT